MINRLPVGDCRVAARARVILIKELGGLAPRNSVLPFDKETRPLTLRRRIPSYRATRKDAATEVGLVFAGSEGAHKTSHVAKLFSLPCTTSAPCSRTSSTRPPLLSPHPTTPPPLSASSPLSFTQSCPSILLRFLHHRERSARAPTCQRLYVTSPTTNQNLINC